MVLNNAENIEEVGRLEPDPFELSRRLKAKLTCCSGVSCAQHAHDIRYLWIYASKGGFTSPAEAGTVSPINNETWMNIVDEAAALGVEWLVLSLDDSLSSFPAVWEIFHWAQGTYGINVVFHTSDPALLQGSEKHLSSLDIPLTHLFVPYDRLADFAKYSASGITVHAADTSTTTGEHCGMPGNMLFVTAEGKLYTCGMVLGKEDYFLGDVHDGLFQEILGDKEKPHTISKSAMTREKGCEGCPPLVLHRSGNVN